MLHLSFILDMPLNQCSACNHSWLAIIAQLTRDGLKCAGNPLVSGDKPAQESEGVYDDGYGAAEVNQNEEPGEC